MSIAATPKESNEEYHADQTRTSNSDLTLMEESPELFHAIKIAKTMKYQQTDPMKFGHLVHCLVLEPMEFANRYSVSPVGIDRRTNVGKAAWAKFESDSIGKELIKQEDFADAKRCTSQLLAHRLFRDRLGAPAASVQIEKRINFHVEGLDMRCKPDWLCPERRLIIDVKTAQQSKRSRFASSLEKLGYHRQSWLYREAARQQYGFEFRFWFAVVKTSAPFETACFELDAKGTEDGKADALALIQQFRIRTATGNWLADESQGDSPMYISTSRWHKTPQTELQEYEEDTVTDE